LPLFTLHVSYHMVIFEIHSVYATVAAKLADQVSGKVSLEVDPRVSHDAKLVMEEVQELARILHDNGVEVKSKILFKIPGTWEGILAAKMLTLQQEFGCQVTHVYSMAQATAAADAKVAVIQPYVGRINDWYRANPSKVPRELETSNYGVNLVKKIYNFVKKYDMESKVVAASIRNVDEAIALAGIDYMILSPSLIRSLAALPGSFGPPALSPEGAGSAGFTPQDVRGYELGECAEELLKASVTSAGATVDKVEEVLANTAIGNM